MEFLDFLNRADGKSSPDCQCIARAVFAILVGFFTLSFGQGSWQIMHGPGQPFDLNKVVFTADGQHGWAVGTSGTVLHTADAGVTWSSQSTGTKVTFYAVHFVDSRNGWIAGANGTLLRTRDGGGRWISLNSGISSHLKDIFFYDLRKGWTAGENGVVLHTDDGGDSWSLQNTRISKDLSSLCFIDANKGWCAGIYGTAIQTINGGATWSRLAGWTTGFLNDLFFANAHTGWTVGDSGAVFKTEDAGSTWHRQITPAQSTLHSIAFADPDKGWIIGNAGLILQTQNGGNSWSLQNSGTTQNLTDVTFPNPQVGWIVGTEGLMLLYTLPQGPHFKFAARTGESYSVVIDDVQLDHLPLQPEYEIGLFTDKGLCVGATVWPQALPFGIIAWADDIQTAGIDGYQAGDSMVFRIWDADATEEYPAIAIYQTGDGHFESGQYSRLRMLDGYTDLQPPQVTSLQPENNSANNPIDCAIVIHLTDHGSGIDPASLFMSVDGIQISPQVEGDSAEFILTYAPPAPYGYNKIISVTVGCEDARHNRMADYSCTFGTIIDLLPPALSGQVPSPNSGDAPRTTSIMAHIVDATSGVEQSSISMRVNGVVVHPAITGTLNDYSVSYAPPVPYSYADLVTVSVAATDQAGNIMGPAVYQFTIMQNPNIAPAAAVLIGPQNDAFINDLQPQLSWGVPQDQNSDSLHFMVEMATDAGFINPVPGSPFDSKKNPAEFSPAPPLLPGRGTCRFTVPSPLAYGIYWWRVTALDKEVAGPVSPLWRFNLNPTGIGEPGIGLPENYELGQNYPNPFNPATTISFAVPKSGWISLQIIDIHGRVVKDLVQGEKAPGRYTVSWNSENGSGDRVASGLYLCRMQVQGHLFIQKLILTK